VVTFCREFTRILMIYERKAEMTTKEISIDDLKQKLGARIKRMSPAVRSIVFGGSSTLALDGVTYRAVSDDELALVHKSAPAPRIVAALEPEPEPEKRRDLVAEYHAELAAERGPSEPVRPFAAAPEPTKPTTVARSIGRIETSHEVRVRLQREADARKAATQGKRPASSSKLARLLGGNDPEAA
jgi:hypothetical protein